jgi:hypothetical protein
MSKGTELLIMNYDENGNKIIWYLIELLTIYLY